MNLFKNVHESWIPLLHSLAYKESMVNFLTSLNEISYQPVYKEIFKVFEMPVQDIKLVILGQEPYPIPGTAIGRAFAVSEKSKVPRVLENIKQEILDTLTPHVKLGGPKASLMESIRPYQQFIKMQDDKWKTLNHWTEQGVFLLNCALTVETGRAGSHFKHWKEFTDMVISFISHEKPCIWMLWGDYARVKGAKIQNPLLVRGYDRISIEEVPIDPKINYIVPGKHPATIIEKGLGFSEDGFYYTNRILEKQTLKKIIW